MNNFIKGFVFAFSGLFLLIKTERNFQIHLIIFSIVLFFGYYFDITSLEWIIILIVSGLVFSLEAVNTAIEKLSDVVEPKLNEKIKIIKDVAAAAVLVASIFAAITGIIIFWKYTF